MSPELIHAPGAVDARSDVWALGVVRFEMLAGDVPFSGDPVPGGARASVGAEPPVGGALAPAPEGLQAAGRWHGPRHCSCYSTVTCWCF